MQRLYRLSGQSETLVVGVYSVSSGFTSELVLGMPCTVSRPTSNPDRPQYYNCRRTTVTISQQICKRVRPVLFFVNLLALSHSLTHQLLDRRPHLSSRVRAMISLPGFGWMLGSTIAVSGSNRGHTGGLRSLYVAQIIAHI